MSDSEGWFELSKPVLKEIIDSLKPVISKFFRDKKVEQEIEKYIQEYLYRISRKCSNINCLAYGNESKPLFDLYEPLTITNDSNQSFQVSNRSNVFTQDSQIIVVDSAGMGKSTLSKRLVLDLIENTHVVPIYIELRTLGESSIIDESKRLLGLPEGVSEKLVEELPLAFILDGLDEVTPKNIKRTVNEINAICINYPGTPTLLTSRNEGVLSNIQGFARYTISPLKKKEAYKLLRNYDKTGKISGKLIEELKQLKTTSLVEFLKTPLYVSLLYLAYKYKPIIPRKKELFYYQVFQALYESHDLSKDVGYVREKYSGLDFSDFNKVLKRFAFACLMSGGAVELDKDTAVKYLSDIIDKWEGISCSARSFYKDITSTVPLFIEEGSTVRWTHKSLMEYFSSTFICHDAKDNQKKILRRIVEHDDPFQFVNVLELCADIDYTAFRAEVMKEVLESYIKYYNQFREFSYPKGITKEDIEYRIFSTFDCESSIYIDSGDFNIDLATTLIREKESTLDDSGNKRIRSTHISVGDVHVFSKRFYGISNILMQIYLSINETESKKYKVSESGGLTIAEKKWHKIVIKPYSRINSVNNFKKINRYLSRTPHQRHYLDIDFIEGELHKIKSDSSNGINSLIDDFF